MEQVHDPVNKPAHYTDGKIEVIDFIEDKKLGFCLGNAVKYISRAGKKDPDKEVEDLRKAIWYINRRIKEIQGEPKFILEPVKHGAPISCKVGRKLFGESPSALLCKCGLGRTSTIKKCEGCKYNIAKDIRESFIRGLKEGLH